MANHKHLTVAHHLLGSSTRVRLLRVLLFADGERLWVRSLFRKVGAGASSVQRELEWLRDLGMVRMYRLGGAAYYEVVPGHPLLSCLQQLLEASELLDEAGGQWHAPFEETRRRNQERRLEYLELIRAPLGTKHPGRRQD